MTATASAFDPRDLRPPRERGTGRALLMAIAMHGLLFVGLWIGVAWKSEEPATVEAELWSSIPQYAAPAPKPPPQPEPASVPKPAPPAPVRTEPEVAKPDIALERKREDERRKAEEKKREQDRLDQLEKEKQAKLAEQKRRDQEKKRDEERFNRQVQQLAAMAGETAPAGAPASGSSARTSGPRGDSAYAGRIAQRIRGNTVFDVPADLVGNPAVQFRVDLDPAGYVLSVRKMASSGLPGFDEAVERAIRKSEPFPADASGRPPSSLDIQHRPKDR